MRHANTVARMAVNATQGDRFLVVLEGSQPRPVKEMSYQGLIKWGTKKASGEFVEVTFIALSRSFGVELDIFALKI